MDNPLIKDASDQCFALLNLKNGWDSCDAKPIKLETVQTAVKFLNFIEAFVFETPLVIPMAMGGIQFEWSCEGYSLEIEILEEGRIVAYFNGECDIEDCEIDVKKDLKSLVKAFSIIRRNKENV